jgi:pimeloyl-ACP methyl ester carboxylesterase
MYKQKKIILETPYYSIPSMFACYAFIYPTNLLSRYKIPTNEYLQKVQYPITIFHGTKDGVIPYSNAKKLEEFLKPTDKFITIEGADHININNTKLYYQSLDSLLQ